MVNIVIDVVSRMDGSGHWLGLFFFNFKSIVVYGWEHGRLLATGLIFFRKQFSPQNYPCDQFEIFWQKVSFVYTVIIVIDVVSRMDGSGHRFELFDREFC